MEDNEIEEIKKRIEDHEKRISNLELEKGNKDIKEDISLPQQGSIDKLTKKLNVPEDKIKELFYIEDNRLTLTKLPSGDTKERTKSISLIILLGYKNILNNENILAIDLRRSVAEHKIPLNNFATYLNEMIPSLIIRKGKPKSAKTSYKLTTLGKATAIDKLKDLIG